MVFILRRPERVTCADCGASHPAIYKGRQCVIRGSTIDAASGHPTDAGTMAFEKHRANGAMEQQYKAELATLQSERDALRAACRLRRPAMTLSACRTTSGMWNWRRKGWLSVTTIRCHRP